MRLAASLGPRPPRNQMLGPPQAAASTYARSEVDSSSTSDPRAAAQKRATRRASTQSTVRSLMNAAMPSPSRCEIGLRAPGSIRNTAIGPGTAPAEDEAMRIVEGRRTRYEDVG